MRAHAKYFGISLNRIDNLISLVTRQIHVYEVLAIYSTYSFHFVIKLNYLMCEKFVRRNKKQFKHETKTVQETHDAR